jgi:DNA-binding response OmpR family regulator
LLAYDQLSAINQKNLRVFVRVLLVDDERHAADMLALLLRAEGIEVIVAYDGGSAISVGTAGHFDAMILDLGLGDVDGYEVAKAVRARHGDAPTLVAYTGFQGDAVRQRAQASGFNRVILKPASVASLVAALRG